MFIADPLKLLRNIMTVEGKQQTPNDVFTTFRNSVNLTRFFLIKIYKEFNFATSHRGTQITFHETIFLTKDDLKSSNR